MSQEWRENQIWEWRQRLQPYVTDVINRLEEEEKRRKVYELVRTRKRNSSVSMFEQ